MKAINKHGVLVDYGNESVQDVRKTGYPYLLRQAAKAQPRSNFINPIQVNAPNSHRPKDHGTDDMVLYIEQGGQYIPLMILTNSMDKEYDMYDPGCFDEDIRHNPDKYQLFNHKPKL